MFKELKGLGVVVKELSNELRQLVRRKPNRPSGGGVQETVCLPVCLPACLSALFVFVCCLVAGLHLCMVVQQNNIRHILYSAPEKWQL